MWPGSPFDSHWKLPASPADYLIVRSADPLLGEHSRRVPPLFLTSRLERWLDSPFSASVLESLYQSLGGVERSSWSQPTTYRQQLKARLTRAFESGELVALELERPAYTSSPAPPPTARRRSPEPVLSEEHTFVALELVDDEGRPMGYQRFRLELPDGRTREGRLNAQGYARVEGLRPGQCKVSFPDLDAEAWS